MPNNYLILITCKFGNKTSFGGYITTVVACDSLHCLCHKNGSMYMYMWGYYACWIADVTASKDLLWKVLAAC